MKTCFLFAALAATLCAQAPSGGASPDTVIATVDGNKLTVGDLQKLLNNSRPELYQYFRQNPPDAIAQVFAMRYLAAEAEKLKLYDETPWKEQLEIQRQELMFQAMTTHERNHYQVSSDEIAAFYEANKIRFEQVKVKDIKISFKPGQVPSGTSPDDIKKMAEIAVAAAHSTTDRPEADAKKIADDLVKQLRNGGDFSKLVAQYSEDQETKESGGEFGVIKSTSSYPADLKTAALRLKAGDVSEPIKVGNVAFYILKAEERTFQPMAEVSETIVQEIRQQHVQQEVKDLVARFKPVIENPQVLMQFTSTPAGQAPPKK
jgi:parvulin-like peptidyl-prolyl isomerase